MADPKLTTRQQQIFEFIKRYTHEKGYPPTVRDIGGAIGLTSSSTVHAHLANLERLGLLRRDPTKPRAMEELADKAKPAVVPPRPRAAPPRPHEAAGGGGARRQGQARRGAAEWAPAGRPRCGRFADPRR